MQQQEEEEEEEEDITLNFKKKYLMIFVVTMI